MSIKDKTMLYKTLNSTIAGTKFVPLVSPVVCMKYWWRLLPAYYPDCAGDTRNGGENLVHWSTGLLGELSLCLAITGIDYLRIVQSEWSGVVSSSSLNYKIY